jgi:hypothetical protein
MSEDTIEPMPMETDSEMRELLGLFDAPSFARRGMEVEFGISRIHARLRRERGQMLEMVRLRLRQWAGAAIGPDDWAGAFFHPIADLWELVGAGAPVWALVAAPARRRRAIARDLVASLTRFNRRWSELLHKLDLAPFNEQIDQYNRHYLLEKECCLGSARLAARFFEPRPRLTVAALLAEYPLLPVPELAL